MQQAYLGTTHRAVIVLEGWDTAGKGGVVRRLGWALDPRSFKVHAIAAPSEREKSTCTTCNASGSGCRNMARSSCSTVPGMAACWSSGRGLRQPHRMAAAPTTRSTSSSACCSPTAPAGQDLPAHHAGGAGAPIPQPADRSAEALEAILRGLPQPRPLAGIRGRDRGHDGKDLHPSRALASDSRRTTSLGRLAALGSSPTASPRACRSSPVRSTQASSTPPKACWPPPAPDRTAGGRRSSRPRHEARRGGRAPRRIDPPLAPCVNRSHVARAHRHRLGIVELSRLSHVAGRRGLERSHPATGSEAWRQGTIRRRSGA